MSNDKVFPYDDEIDKTDLSKVLIKLNESLKRESELKSKLELVKSELGGAIEYLKSCGYLNVEDCDPDKQMLLGFINLLKVIGSIK